MEMVAAARLRRAEQRIAAMRPYAQAIRKMTRQAAEAAGSLPRIELLEERDRVESAGILLVTGDRGLAGSFNTQIIREGLRLGREFESDGANVSFSVVGRRGNSTMTFRGENVAHSYVGFTDRPSYHDAQAVAHRLAELYADDEIDRAVLVYNHYISPLVQRVVLRDLLPLSEGLLETDQEEREEQALRGDFIFEPEPEQILERLLPVYLETELYRALLESAASEHGARMTAMRSASKNAGELIDDLTLAMNRARQAEITQEILEVVAGADALTA